MLCRDVEREKLLIQMEEAKAATVANAEKALELAMQKYQEQQQYAMQRLEAQKQAELEDIRRHLEDEKAAAVEAATRKALEDIQLKNVAGGPTTGASGTDTGIQDEWMERLDEATGHFYYHNVTTGDVSWELPSYVTGKDDYDGSATAGAGDDGTGGGWVEQDDGEGNVYYYHTVTYETAWEMPEGAVLWTGATQVGAHPSFLYY